MNKRNSIKNTIESWIKKIKECELKGHDLVSLKYTVTSKSNPLRDKGRAICKNCGMDYERQLTIEERNEIYEFQKY